MFTRIDAAKSRPGREFRERSGEILVQCRAVYEWKLAA
jgi:hypothetical protein